MQQQNVGSGNFRACRTLVHDDAFEAILTIHMVTPLLKDGDLASLRREEYLYQSGLFFRRSLTRYLALILCRMLDKPNEKGASGVTASIASLLEMAEKDGVLNQSQVGQLTQDFEKIKANAQREYDLIKALRNLRNIQVAHSLIPHEDDPTDQVWAHDLLNFASEIFDFVVALEKVFAEVTKVTLPDLSQNADTFRSKSQQFWASLASPVRGDQPKAKG
jgi:hypothetical protein